jgi:hypothetical protein
MKALASATLLIAAALALLAPGRSDAVLINVDFIVRGAPDDPVNAGKTAKGFFSFKMADDLLWNKFDFPLPYSGSPFEVTEIYLDWNGTVWTTANAGLSFLRVNYSPLENPTNLLFGYDSVMHYLEHWTLAGIVSGGVGVQPGPDPDVRASDMWFDYTSGDGTVYWGSSTITKVSIAEPGTLLLVGLGLGVLGMCRKGTT